MRPHLLAWACGVAAVAAASNPLSASPARWEIHSPNETLVLRLDLSRSRNNRLSYRVEHDNAAVRAVVVADSPLGVVLQDEDLTEGLRFDSATTPSLLEESYTMVHGKRHRCYNTATATTLRFRNKHGGLLELDLRAYDDGVAFRYRIPAPVGVRRTLKTEATGFALRSDARLWMQPSDKVSTYSPAYETYYENGVPVGTVSPTGLGWALPVLFCSADEKHWGLITEAGLGPNSFGARLAATATNGVYHIGLPDPGEGRGYGPTEPSSTLPWQMSWRVIIVGSSPGSIIESTLVDDLSPPSTVADTSWIRPGRVAWSWWSDQNSPQDGAKQKRFVDFAAEMGWEYVLVDENWPIMDNGTIHDVIRYAKEKGVAVLLWYNTGGPNNVVTAKPRDSLFHPEVRRSELQMLTNWGVKGIKVDFFQSDKPEIIKLYQDILKDTARFQMMVNFHGCTLPRGWTRTYPHLMSMEAIRGEECYLFDPLFPERAPIQNTITPFTRNAVGPMDYTPMGLSRAKHPHRTTYAHELALTVLFESGWVHFADAPDVYGRLPDPVKQFLKELPVAWDDTRFVAGFPGRDAILTRRHGNSWYLAGINGLNQPKDLTLDLKRELGSLRYDLTLIGDGPGGEDLVTRQIPFQSSEPLPVSILGCGGFVARLVPAQ